MKHHNHVFCLGINKTGTNTISAILNHIKVPCRHDHRWVRWMLNGKIKKINQSVAWCDSSSYVEGALDTLDDNWPDAKVIMNVRPLRSWLISCHYHLEINKLIRRRFTYHNTPEDVEMWIHRRNMHHTDLMERYNPDRMIKLSLWTDEDPIGKLAKFLGKKAPDDRTVPKMNTAEGRGKRYGGTAPPKEPSIRVVDSVLNRLGITGGAVNEEVFTPGLTPDSYTQTRLRCYNHRD